MYDTIVDHMRRLGSLDRPSIVAKLVHASGVSAATLDDAGMIQFISLRHFNGRLSLQVTFVQRPVSVPSVAYVALLDPGTHAVQALAQANWYLWG